MLKIVYIAGPGRSASTLLSLLLSQQPGVANVGQIRDLPQSWERSVRCSCGVPLASCALWGAAVADALGADRSASLDKLGAGFDAVSKETRHRANWSSASWRREMAGRHADYLETLTRLYMSVARIAGVTTLADSSKSPELALLLSESKQIDLRVIHLMRDPRAIAVSWQRKLDDRKAVGRQCRIWKLRQRQLKSLAAALPNRVRALRYEDFVTAPRAQLQALGEWAGMQDLSACFSSDHEATLSWERQHLFPPANETVLREKRTEVEISLRTGWRAPKHSATRRYASRLTFPTNLLAGYGLL